MITRVLHMLALSWAVATAAMPGLLAVAEGAGEAAATAAVESHVENAGGSDACPVAHDAHCAACTMLRHGHTGPAAIAGSWAVSCAARAVVQFVTPAADGRLTGSGNPRAPPAA